MGLRAKAVYILRQFPFITPRSIVSSCAEWIDNLGKQKGIYFNQRGPWYKTMFSENFLQQPAPLTLGEVNDKAFYNNRNYPTPKASLFYLQNSYVFGHKGLILSAKHEVFQEFSHHFSMATLKKFFRKNLFYTFSKKARKMNGVGAVLVSPESHNYYHWLSDVLPRIKLYEGVLDQIDHFCLASNVPGRFLEVLKDFGIADEKVLLIHEKEKIHFDHLYVASLPGSEGRSPQWAVHYVREKLVKPVNTAPSKKIYFTRGENAERNILNESELVTALQGEGFEIIDPGKLSIRGQVDIMQGAKILVSAHGGALSNLLFSRDNTAVVELFSPDYFRTDCYYTLSALCQLNYWYIVGDKPSGAAWGDITLSLKLLTDTIQQVEGK